MKQASIKDKDKLLVRLNMITPEIAKLTKEANLIREQLKDIEIKVRARGVHITNHAIERFKERITGYRNNTDVKDLVLTQEFIDKVHSSNSEHVEHPTIPNCICVVVDNLILTITTKFDPEWQLRQLGQYMNYFINRIADNEVPISFIEFKAKGYKYHQLNTTYK